MSYILRYIIAVGMAGGLGVSSGWADAPPVVTVAQLRHQVLAENPELARYEAELDAARSQRRLAGRWLNPELDLEVGRKRARDGAGALAGEGTVWSASVTQTLEWPGRIALREAIANADVELAELGLERFRAELAHRALALGYSLDAAQRWAEALREVTDRLAVLREVLVAREEGGVTPLLEARVIEAAEIAANHRSVAAELAVREALIELNQLRGASPLAPLRVQTAAPTFTEPPDVGNLVAAARERNFEYRTRQLELAQRGDAVRLARHERLPSVSLSPFISEERAGERERVVGLGFNVPLPPPGRSRGAVDFAHARERQAEAALLVAERELERAVQTAADEFSSRLEQLRRWPPETVQRFRDAAALADRHYRLGAVPVATYVELQSSYLDAMEALLEAQQQAIDAGLRLQRITGVDFNAITLTP